MLEQAGLRAPHIEGPDFRISAAAFSQARVAEMGELVPLLKLDASLCLPLPENARLRPKDVIGANLPILLAAIVGIVAGALLLAAGGDRSQSATGPMMLGAGGLALAAGLAAFVTFLVQAVRGRTANLCKRPGAIVTRASKGRRYAFKLEDAQTYHVRKDQPDDDVVCLLDAAGRRLLMEGCLYRYIIRGTDVVRIAPVESGTTVAVELAARIGDTTLTLVLSRENGAAHALGPLLASGISTSVVKKMRRALGVT